MATRAHCIDALASHGRIHGVHIGVKGRFGGVRQVNRKGSRVMVHLPLRLARGRSNIGFTNFALEK